MRWWNSLHQQQSNPDTVSKPFWLPLRANAFGILFLMVGFIMLRARIAALRLESEMAPPPPDREIGAARGGRMSAGVVTGGWNFVIAAYAITVAVLHDLRSDVDHTAS